MAGSEAFVIVVSAPGIEQVTFDQAQLAERLVQAKVAHQMELVSPERASDAQALWGPGGVSSFTKAVPCPSGPGISRELAALWHLALVSASIRLPREVPLQHTTGIVAIGNTHFPALLPRPRIRPRGSWAG
ncbi:MAG: hypothetical protein DRI39_07945 [Chloroflexi bacterium]|nr:MAG: hypothetical protein DRI39_07945 [Chloroflexota bacterium]